MMRKVNFLALALLLLAGTSACDIINPDSAKNASEVKQFIWKGMNYWYYWQKDVPELADNKSYFSGEQDFQDYLRGFSDEEALYNALQYKQEDEFSFFINDYKKFAQSQKGISKSFGFSYGLLRTGDDVNLLGYVQYVVPDSPADKAGLKRGDLFTTINDTRLTVKNYQKVLGSDHFDIPLVEINNKAITKTNKTISVTSKVLTEDPIFMTEVIDTASVKIGYMVFNAFQYSFQKEMNDVFGMFLNKGIDDFVIDLRYNGGGALVTSATLAGMISDRDTTDIFETLTYNDKRSAQNTTFPIFNKVPTYNEQGNFDGFIPMNQLGLHKVYVLTGYGTASASEALINGLRAYIDVTVIGGQTVGKDEGSITVYDAPPTYSASSLKNVNPDHNRAIQPIVFKIVNKDGQKYPDGFTPDYAVDETDSLANLKPLGDVDEPLLSKAIQLITNKPMAKTKPATNPLRSIFMDSRDLKPHGKEMYILPANE